MKKIPVLAALSLCLLLAACSTTSTTQVTTYDSAGNTVSSSTTTNTANQTMEAVNKAGTAVKEGDQVMTVEAMKMNTVIYAPANGTVTSFAVKPGDTVTEGQTLAYIG